MTGFSHHNARVNQNKWSRARTSLYLRYLSLSELFLGIKVFLNFRVAGCLPNVRTLKVPHVPHFYGWLPTALKACTSLPHLLHTKCVPSKKFLPTPVPRRFHVNISVSDLPAVQQQPKGSTRVTDQQKLTHQAASGHPNHDSRSRRAGTSAGGEPLAVHNRSV